MSRLDWATLGAVPEMLQTSHGSLTVGLDARPGQSILIRGGTSSIGMATAVLSKRLGMTVLSTTRNPDRADALRRVGVDVVLVDDGNVAEQARQVFPDGVETALELVGTPTLPDTLRATRVHGVVCFTGMLSNEWTVPDFYPIEYLPRGVRLTAYGGDATDLPAVVLQDFLDAVAAGEAIVPIHHVYRLDDIAQAHADMEAGRATGKLVVVPCRRPSLVGGPLEPDHSEPYEAGAFTSLHLFHLADIYDLCRLPPRSGRGPWPRASWR